MKKHPLLIRQINKTLGKDFDLSSPEIERLFNSISNLFFQYESDLNLSYRALDISSSELNEAFDEIKEKSDKQEDTLDELSKLLLKLEENPRAKIDNPQEIITRLKSRLI